MLQHAGSCIRWVGTRSIAACLACLSCLPAIHCGEGAYMCIPGHFISLVCWGGVVIFVMAGLRVVWCCQCNHMQFLPSPPFAVMPADANRPGTDPNSTASAIGGSMQLQQSVPTPLLQVFCPLILQGRVADCHGCMPRHLVMMGYGSC